MLREQVDFLGFPAEFSADIQAAISTLKIEKPYKYICRLDHGVFDYVDNLGKQAKVNLVCESIKQHSAGKVVFWHRLGSDAEVEERIKNINHASLEPLNVLANAFERKTVFIAMAFSAWDDEDESAQKEVLIRSIKFACKKQGYDADIVPADHTGSITDRIIADIKRSRFVVCDFTHQNQGAYYEAGYARALGKNVYHLVRKDHFDNLHFDIKQINCRSWDSPEDVESMLADWIAANEDVVD